ncbi:hypothetical protein UA08_02429 [Talaromyces atroroseus]|uniref:gamma-glutamylcyclotransferase n=1 Tax=Talaromyces atroroseus TaxID=1441469 RepID=A0A225AU50_TALAT|nr:hypothetical protein UA08_02429 [Talaromyces atroroseus]OKL61894.1 hypothetical protein UA08_02429 [Talaromyces atroroseus]
MTPSKRNPPLPRTPADRLQLARKPSSVDADPKLYENRAIILKTSQDSSQSTVLYLAYGSNLSVETFRGKRGIEPLSQVNVCVPELKLTFDLAGIPYIEPCFSSTHYRTNDSTDTPDKLYYGGSDDKKDNGEKASFLLDPESALLYGQKDYHKDRWHKPLVGVVYEVTLEDYAHIIATEGGGSGYEDVVVSCFPFPKDYNPNDPTPDVPQTESFMAHTLISPPNPENKGAKKSHLIRPIPSYAQPSARYLKLIMDGADELDFPHDYRAYLASIRPYRATTLGQKVGQKIFLTIWLPLVMLLLALAQLFADDEGITPDWLAKAQVQLHETIWTSYDVFFCKRFGDGERTIGDD